MPKDMSAWVYPGSKTLGGGGVENATYVRVRYCNTQAT